MLRTDSQDQAEALARIVREVERTSKPLAPAAARRVREDFFWGRHYERT
jgi:glycosyltransferase involved in cell wall biosynthesis